MKNKLYLLVIVLLLTTKLIAQRGENPKLSTDVNPYDKIINEPIVGKRTAKFLINFIRPEVLTQSFTSSPCNDFVELSNVRIKQFQEFVEKFNAGEKEAKQMQAADKKFSTDAKISNKLLEEANYYKGLIEKQGTFTSDSNEPIENLLCRAKGSLQNLKSILVYAKQVKLLFSSTPNIDEVITSANQVVSDYADQKTMTAVIKKNLTAAFADVEMPKPVSKNADWEKTFKDYFTKNYLGYTYLKQSLLSEDWYVKKNEISGIAEYKQIGTSIGAKKPDGKCVVIKIDLYQDYIGSKYGNPRFKEFNVQEIICDKLK